MSSLYLPNELFVICPFLVVLGDEMLKPRGMWVLINANLKPVQQNVLKCVTRITKSGSVTELIKCIR